MKILEGDCRETLRTLADNSIDSCVTDPPYALVSVVKRFGSPTAAPAKGNEAYMRASAGFMGKTWDNGETAFDPAFWFEVLRVLKPGAYLAAFGAIEDAGFEIRDSLAWMYGTGFPKSHDVSKGIDRAAGAEREKVRHSNPRNPKAAGGGRDGMEGATHPWIELAMQRGYHELDSDVPATPAAQEWQGWGTALKPAFEPIVLARKPLSESTVAANVLRWRTGALNIDACRVATDEQITATRNAALGSSGSGVYGSANTPGVYQQQPGGRWPANVVHDGSDEVIAAFPSSTITGKRSDASKAAFDAASPLPGSGKTNYKGVEYTDSGSAARFFYSAKASKADRNGSKHPTVKPITLMQWLARLITPPGGSVLDPFAGSGTTGAACALEGFNCVMCEREAEYLADIKRRFAPAFPWTPKMPWEA